MSYYHFAFAGWQLSVASPREKDEVSWSFLLVLSQHRLALIIWVFKADLKPTKYKERKLPCDRSLGHVQVGYSGASEVRPVGSVIFQPLKFKQAVWKRCKNCKLLLTLLIRHELMLSSIIFSFERSSLSLCRNYFLCERSHKDDVQNEDAGRGDGCVSEDPVCF